MMMLACLSFFISFFVRRSHSFLMHPPSLRTQTLFQSTCSCTRYRSSSSMMGRNSSETDEFVFNGADLFGIAVAAQLLGIQDILGETSFWQKGGWFQPVTIESGSTVLSDFLQRFSIMSSVYLGASWIIGNPNVLPENINIIRFSIKTATVYFMIRFLVAVIVATISHQDIILAQILLETYMIALANATTRYVLNNFFFRWLHKFSHLQSLFQYLQKWGYW